MAQEGGADDLQAAGERKAEPLDASVEVEAGQTAPQSAEGGGDEEDPTQWLLRRGESEPSLTAPPSSPRQVGISWLSLLGTLLHFLLVECAGLLLLAFGQLALLSAAARRSATEEDIANMTVLSAAGLAAPSDPTLAATHAAVWLWLGVALVVSSARLLLEVKQHPAVAEHSTGAYVSFVIRLKNSEVHLLTARSGMVSTLVCATLCAMHLSVPARQFAPTGAELCVGLVLCHALRILRRSGECVAVFRASTHFFTRVRTTHECWWRTGGSAAFVVDMEPAPASRRDAFARARFNRLVLWQHGCCESARQLGVLIAHGRLRERVVWAGGYQLDNCALKPGQVTASELDAKQRSSAYGYGLDESCEATSAAPSAESVDSLSFGRTALGSVGGRGAHKPYRLVSVPSASAAGVRWRMMDECQVFLLQSRSPFLFANSLSVI